MAQDQGNEAVQSTVQEPPKINRRRLLGNTARAIAGTAVGIPVVREIKQTVEQKVETSEGVFYPLYEFHGSPIEKLPDKIDVYWEEGVGYEKIDYPEIDDPRGLIKKGLSDRRAKIAFGDVDYRPQDLSKDQLKATSALISASLMAIIPTTAGLAVGNLLEKNPQSRKINRRVVLGGLAASAFAVTSLNFQAQEADAVEGKNLPFIGIRVKEDAPAADAIQKIIFKLNGLLTDFHPEFAIAFFRNAVWAHKLLEYSKKLQPELRRKPNFALAIGGGHAGIEDFLILGEKFAESCILAYPKEWLSEVIKTNGGIEQFSTIKITEPTHSPTEAPSLENAGIFIDQPLADTLTKKLA